MSRMSTMTNICAVSVTLHCSATCALAAQRGSYLDALCLTLSIMLSVLSSLPCFAALAGSLYTVQSVLLWRLAATTLTHAPLERCTQLLLA